MIFIRPWPSQFVGSEEAVFVVVGDVGKAPSFVGAKGLSVSPGRLAVGVVTDLPALVERMGPVIESAHVVCVAVIALPLFCGVTILGASD